MKKQPESESQIADGQQSGLTRRAADLVKTVMHVDGDGQVSEKLDQAAKNAAEFLKRVTGRQS